MMGLPSALYCDKVTSMIFSEEHIAHSSATALAKPNADIAVVLGSCAVASQHWAQRSHCVVEFASITYRY